MKSFTLDGKRYKVHPMVPVADIRWLIGRQHVGDEDDKIKALISQRTGSWPRAARDSAQTLAVWFHRKNQQLVTDLRL